jgi:hypothetical protein
MPKNGVNTSPPLSEYEGFMLQNYVTPEPLSSDQCKIQYPRWCHFKADIYNILANMKHQDYSAPPQDYVFARSVDAKSRNPLELMFSVRLVKIFS